ncbi:hypothetical protein HID58_054361 [Brassica napus]|uniref:Protein kinase domain-containing protein n=1 Tax=Brassica napus TaxID=3708 RepID=A0ABQ8AHC7_BRANA|nr:hypothetical protein HID58_054361 [Brassica napus]
MASLRFLHVFFFFFFHLILHCHSLSGSSDAKLLVGKIKPSLQGASESLLLSSWNSSVPVCQWRGVKWVFSDGSPLQCTALSSSPSSQWTNLSLYNDSSLHLLSLQLPSANLTGSLPGELGEFSMLRSLFLNINALSGPIPLELGYASSLSDVDLSGNALAGAFPPSIWNLCENLLEILNLSHNNFSGMLPSFFGDSKFGAESFQGNNPSLCGLPLKPCLGSSRLSPGAVAGLVIGLMSGAVVVASLLIGYLQNKKRKSSIESEDDLEEGDEEDEVDGGGQGEGKLVVFQGGENLTLEEVLNATGQVMEKTNYGTVYKAKLSDGGNIALRLLREGTCKDRSSCLPVIKQLGRVRHENLIALGIARGLAYLHTGQEAPIIHGNIRSKNVLVDDFFFARLTEFGLDKIMVQAVADEIVSQAKSDGYKAPELHKMKKCNPRSDVYAFGILLLEMLMGKKPGKSGRNGGEYVDLPSLVKAAVLEETTMEVFDLEAMKGIRSPMEEGLVHALKLAMGCCAPVTTVRPSMEEVVKQLEENRPRNRSALYSPTETRSDAETPC